MRRHGSRDGDTPTCRPRWCGFCGGELTASMCGAVFECLGCGAQYRNAAHDTLPRTHPARVQRVYQEEEDPRGELEDPDDRPYLWDLTEEG